MPLFEVFIPAKPGSGGKSMIVQVEASSWLLALRTGLKQVGEQGDSFKQVMVENRPDGTVVVEDPTQKRVFRIKELEGGAEDQAQAEKEREEAARLRSEAEKAVHDRADAERLLREKVQREQEAQRIARASDDKDDKQAAARAALERADAERVLADRQRRETDLAHKAYDEAEGTTRQLKVAYSDAHETMDDGGEAVQVSWDVNDMLSDMFMETMDILEKDEKEALDFILVLADRVVKADASSVILSDVNSVLADLYFAAARGPVTAALKAIRIPRGKGIVGFSVNLNIPLTVSEVQANPNFYGAVDKKSGFITRSILCVPIMYENRVLGAIELINKKGSNRWAQEEVNVITFLSQKLGERLGRLHDEVKLDFE